METNYALAKTIFHAHSRYYYLLKTNKLTKKKLMFLIEMTGLGVGQEFQRKLAYPIVQLNNTILPA